MAESSRFRLPSGLVLAILIAMSATVGAQAPCISSPVEGSRLAGDWHASAAVPLEVGKPVAVPAGADLGVAPSNTRLDRMLLLLEPSPSQEQALVAFLQNQQLSGNCAYHQWLTPPRFADAFANSASDVAAISAWLAQQGFAVAPLPAGRGWIEFSGTAAQVEQAFGAAVHGYSTAAGTRYALTGGISIPTAFVPVVRGLVSLDGAISTPALTVPQAVATKPAALAAQTSPNQAEALTPQLIAPLLHLDALHAAGTTGAGQTIAIAARSNVQTQDIAAFRSTFALPASPVTVSLNGPDPGLTPDQAEAEFAASWAGATAPGAHIVLVPAASTAATDGTDLSLAAIVDQDLAHTLVVDFSSCEDSLSDAHQAFYAAVYRQAAAEGIAAIVAAGDSGAAACHAPGSDTAVTTGYAVNGLASTPWNTAIGAAAFEATDGSSFAAWSPVAPADPAYAGGGGRSTVYPVPAWQAAIQPESSGRMLPDIALPTGVNSAFSHGLAFCFNGTATASGCTLMRSGGSSAAAAIFGGIAALIAQQDGPEGNLAPALYPLSARSGIFNDVQQGAATLTCATGSPDCDDSGKLGYAAANGYDLATGLGSPNAQALLSALAQPDGTGADTVTLAVSPSQSSYNPSASLTFTATVASSIGGATPTGTVNFTDQTTGNNLNSTPYSLTSGQASITVSGALANNTNNIIAAYSGDGTYEQLNSQPLAVTIQPSTTTTTITPATYNPTPGTAFNVTVTVAVGNPPAGTSTPTGNISLTIDSQTPLTQAVTSSGGVTSATFSVTVSSSGSHALVASYAGDANYQTSTSQSVIVNAATETASVTLSVAPTQANLIYNPSAPLTFSAVVASQNGGATPSGTLNFFDQATGLNLNANPLTLNSGKATVTVNGGLPVNGNSIIGQYTPATGSPYGSANSQALTVNIQPSSTITTVKPSTTTPAVGTTFAVTATVATGTPPAGQASPTGTMTLTLDGANPQTASVTTTGGVTTASFSVTVKSSGGHNLQAFYAGDTNYAASNSAPFTVNGGNGGTVTTLTANPAILTPGTPESFTATITAANPVAGVTNTFTGSVTFFDGTTQLGTAGVSANAATLSNITLTGSTHSITAVYSGDGNWAGSTSAAFTLQGASYPVTVTLTSSPAVPGPGQAVTLIATVTPNAAPPSTAEQNPSGNVIFYNGTTALGTVALTPAQGDASTASFSITSLAAGQDSLTAVYVGDLYFATSASNAITVTLQGFTITPAPGNPPADLDIVEGSSGQAAFVVAGVGGFNSPLNVVCSVPFQADMTCAVSPKQVTPTQTVTLTLTTYSSGGPSSARRDPKPLWPPAAGGAAFGALLLLFLPAGRRARMFFPRGRRMLILLLLLVGFCGAGIGCSSISTVTPTKVDGTPLGETTVSITAAANVDNTVVSHTAYLPVNVLPQGSTGSSQPGTGAQ